MGKDYWRDLRFGSGDDIARALRALRDAHDRNRDASHIMELGAAYLWVREYQKAADHFESALETHLVSIDDFFGMAGVARWSLGDYRNAVKIWTTGLEAEFSDTAGLGVGLPLLLFVASTLTKSVYGKGSALKLLKEKANDSRINVWPGPIAKWVLGELSEEELNKECSACDKSDKIDRLWLAQFYREVFQYNRAKSRSFRLKMQELADTTTPEWLDDTFFLARVWGEEFFLARHLTESAVL